MRTFIGKAALIPALEFVFRPSRASRHAAALHIMSKYLILPFTSSQSNVNLLDYYFPACAGTIIVVPPPAVYQDPSFVFLAHHCLFSLFVVRYVLIFHLFYISIYYFYMSSILFCSFAQVSFPFLYPRWLKHHLYLSNEETFSVARYISK